MLGERARAGAYDVRIRVRLAGDCVPFPPSAAQVAHAEDEQWSGSWVVRKQRRASHEQRPEEACIERERRADGELAARVILAGVDELVDEVRRPTEAEEESPKGPA